MHAFIESEDSIKLVDFLQQNRTLIISPDPIVTEGAGKAMSYTALGLWKYLYFVTEEKSNETPPPPNKCVA